MGSRVDVRFARPRCPCHFVLLPGRSAWWPQQLVPLWWPWLCARRFVHRHEIPIVRAVSGLNGAHCLDFVWIKAGFPQKQRLKLRCILGAPRCNERYIRRREHSGEPIKPLLGKGNHRVVTTSMLFTGVELHLCHSQQGYPQVGENFQLGLCHNHYGHCSRGLRPSFCLHRDGYPTRSFFDALHRGTNDPTNGLR